MNKDNKLNRVELTCDRVKYWLYDNDLTIMTIGVMTVGIALIIITLYLGLS